MSIARTNELTSAEQAEAQLQARREAAKARKRAAVERAGAAEAAIEEVAVRITRYGDGLVSTGEHVGGEGDLCFDAGETANFPRPVAEALERKGLAEIVGPASAPVLPLKSAKGL